MAGRKTTFVVCVSNAGFPASLDVRKIYRSLPDPAAERKGLIRVVDKSGDDSLYSKGQFVPIEVPQAAIRKLAMSTEANSGS